MPLKLELFWAADRELIDRAAVEKVLRLHRNELIACYGNALLGRGDFSARLALECQVDAFGRARGAHGVSSSNTDEGLVECVTRQITGLRFPPPRRDVTVGYTFHLDPRF
jgi:hypothetical protein